MKDIAFNIILSIILVVYLYYGTLWVLSEPL